jgi:hypothetical protein
VPSALAADSRLPNVPSWLARVLFGLCLLACSACDIDAHVNPAYGCNASCLHCVRGFCYDARPTDAGRSMDASPADAAAEAGADAGRCDSGELGSALQGEVCDACNSCANGQVCCRGECAANCNPVCGNGFVEPGEECEGGPKCSAECKLRFDDSLAHRYEFNGTGVDAIDSIGGAEGKGTVIKTKLTGSGDLVLAGGTSDQYVDLPNGLIRGLSSVTVEIWVSWTGKSPRQRLFDFGYNGGDDMRGMGTSYLYATPRNGTGTGSDATGNFAAYLNFTRTAGDTGEDTVLQGTGPLSMGIMHQVAVVFDGSADTFLLYLDGTIVDTATHITGMLAQIDDRNMWIGRANFPEESLQATVHEFRIYNDALTEAAVSASYAAGPDP